MRTVQRTRWCVQGVQSDAGRCHYASIRIKQSDGTTPMALSLPLMALTGHDSTTGVSGGAVFPFNAALDGCPVLEVFSPVQADAVPSLHGTTGPSGPSRPLLPDPGPWSHQLTSHSWFEVAEKTLQVKHIWPDLPWQWRLGGKLGLQVNYWTSTELSVPAAATLPHVAQDQH